MSNTREKLIDEAIAHFDYGVTHDIFSEPVTTARPGAVTLKDGLIGLSIGYSVVSKNARLID